MPGDRPDLKIYHVIVNIISDFQFCLTKTTESSFLCLISLETLEYYIGHRHHARSSIDTHIHAHI